MTDIHEIGDGIYRVHTGITEIPGGFSFNQILVVDDEPLLFHTGGRGFFPGVRAAIERVLPIDKLRWIGFSHVESDECGALNEFLAAAPHATAFASRVGATIAMGDSADRPVRPLGDGETLATGRRSFTWLDAPHVPHSWECGFLFETTSKTLLCGDLFTQPGATTPPTTDGDILGPSEAFRKFADYYSYSTHTRAHLERMAALAPRTLACMHGSAWIGDGGKQLRALAEVLAS
jgi:flavorubredoxin